MNELLPLAGVFPAGRPVRIELRGDEPAGELVVWSLGDEVARHPVTAIGVIDLGELAPGGYGVEWVAGERMLARTAVDVRTDPRARLRYGFTADFSSAAHPEGLAETVRRLHLTGVMFYDWAYRHADLLGGGESYHDPLGQEVTLTTVRRSIRAVQEAGARALGYAAVYAVGPQEWDLWRHDALLQATGEPFALGDFLFLVDPAATDWNAHFTGDLRAATASLGFDGYHLDQFGYPKTAVRADGAVIDLTESFTALIERVRAALPEATLVFNNVNDFPTWRTGQLPQDAAYIEPWEPNLTLPSLAGIVQRAHAADPQKPVVLAAYQHVYDSATTEESDRATALTMATLYSHGATQILAGEADRILVDPYYVRNAVAAESTAALLRRWYDFLVEHDALLSDPAAVDVTAAYAGAYNDDITLDYPDAATAWHAEAGAVWARVVQVGDRLVIHAINLTGQTDLLWDAARAPFGSPGSATLRVRALQGRTPRIRVADPDYSPRLTDVAVQVEGTHAVATLPEPGAWQLIVIDLDPEQQA